MADPCADVRSFIDAYAAGDVAAMRAKLADGFVGYVTNGEGGVDRVDGADGYLGRLPELASADATASVTQSVQVSSAQALTMVEIRAVRQGRELHNFGAFLSRSDAEGCILEIWMVDALPAYSDEFWS